MRAHAARKHSCIRQPTSAHTSAHTPAYASRRQQTSAYVSMRQQTSAYVNFPASAHTTSSASPSPNSPPPSLGVGVTPPLPPPLSRLPQLLRRPPLRPLCGEGWCCALCILLLRLLQSVSIRQHTAVACILCCACCSQSVYVSIQHWRAYCCCACCSQSAYVSIQHWRAYCVAPVAASQHT